MSSKLKVLTVLLESETAQSVEAIAVASGVKLATVRTVLGRRPDVLLSHPDARGSRGGVPRVWAVRPEKRASLVAEVMASMPAPPAEELPFELASLHSRLIDDSRFLSSDDRTGLLLGGRATLARLARSELAGEASLMAAVDSFLLDLVEAEETSADGFASDLLTARAMELARVLQLSGAAHLRDDLEQRLHSVRPEDPLPLSPEDAAFAAHMDRILLDIGDARWIVQQMSMQIDSDPRAIKRQMLDLVA